MTSKLNELLNLLPIVHQFGCPALEAADGGLMDYTCTCGNTRKARQIIEALIEETERAANFKAMVYVLLSIPEARFVITKAALEESPEDYEIVTKPDSRLSGVEYTLYRATQESKEQQQ